MNNVMPDWGQNDLVVFDKKEVVTKNTEQIFPITFSDFISSTEFKQNMENLISFFTKHNPPELTSFDLDDVYSQKGKIPFPKEKDLPYDQVVGLCGEYGIDPLNVTSIKVTDHETDKCLKVITMVKYVTIKF